MYKHAYNLSIDMHKDLCIGVAAYPGQLLKDFPRLGFRVLEVASRLPSQQSPAFGFALLASWMPPLEGGTPKKK